MRTLVGDIVRGPNLAVALQATKHLLHFHFTKMTIHPDVFHQKLQFSSRYLDRHFQICSLSAESIHEWNKTVATDPCNVFICLLCCHELHILGRQRLVWWRELEMAHTPMLNRGEEIFSTNEPQGSAWCSRPASLLLHSSYRGEQEKGFLSQHNLPSSQSF